MAQLYQWTLPCTICESPVEYHCNTCGDVFCGNCRGIHLKSKASRHHVIVPYSQRVEPTESLQCGDHPGHQCGVWCQTCNRAVCNECLISPSHKGHDFLKFDEKIGEKRKEIQSLFDRCSALLSDWQNSLEEAKKMEEKYVKDVKQLDKEIVDRADELCKQVRTVEKERRKQLQEMKNTSLRVLQNQQKMLTEGMQRLKKKINELEDTLRSSDTSAILQYSTTEKEVDRKPTTCDPPLVPVFTPGSLDIEVLKNMLGSLSDKGVPRDESKPMQSKQMMSLLREPSVESVISIQEGGYTPAIACVGSGQAWVRTDWQTLQRVDRQGIVQKTVNTDFYMDDMAMTPRGNILLPDYYNKCIKSMSMDGNIRILFSTKWKPYGICCLPSGDIVVAFTYDGRVVQYSSTGKVVREMDRSMFQHPWYLAHSQVNQQLYVCDKSEHVNLGASGRVLALDMNGTLQYKYTGPDPTTFTPVDVCTDKAGHVLITDINNHRVHILDKGGNFLQYLLTKKQGLTKPTTIDVDSEGYAWIGEWLTRKVKVVKYAK